MKKFLALLFVCAGMTAMAATPHVNKANLTNKANAPMATKAQKFVNPTQSGLSVQSFLKKNNLKLSDNPLMKKAPRRLSADQVIGTKVGFFEQYDWTVDESNNVMVDTADQFYSGGWDVNLAENSDGTILINEGMYYTFNQNLEVDYAAQTVTMNPGQVYETSGSKTVASGQRARYIYDSVEYVFVYNEDWFTEDAEAAPVVGQVYDDGSLYFENGFVYYFLKVMTTTYQTRPNSQSTNWTTQSETTDTTGSASYIFRNTYLMTPNGQHTCTGIVPSDIVAQYVQQGYPAEYFAPEDMTNNVYMYQYNDSVVVAWNVFGGGQRGQMMYIWEDGTMAMPSQVAYETSEGRDYSNIGVDWDVVADTADWNNARAYNLGTVTNDMITWDYTCLFDMNSGYYLIQYYKDNKLFFTDGEKFLLGKAETPSIQVVEGDDAYTFTGVSAEDGAVVYLMTFDVDSETGTVSNIVAVDNPYVVERTSEDQVIYLAAVADGSAIGKNASDPAMGAYTIPAKVEPTPYLRGDVNGDGQITINDVTTLVNHVLMNDFNDVEGFNSENADCNLDGKWNISDVTALINYILSKQW